MRVFIYEYLSSGASADASADSLHSEGWAMLSAVVEDFARCPGVEAVTVLDPRLALAQTTWPRTVAVRYAEPAGEEQTFRSLAAVADWSLVIAPEFDDILAQRCRWVEEAGSRLLGPSSAAVRLTADKRTLARHWLTCAIPTPPIVDPSAIDSPIHAPFPCVLKPRYGAGSQATFLVRDSEDLLRITDVNRGAWQGETLLQAYAPGRAVSVALLAGNRQLHSLPATEQHVSNDGRFHYLGGRLPLTKELDDRARRLAERAVRAVEGLHGYFGVDLVLGDVTDGSRDQVIEINPRLTTSYVGLRRLARFNLVEALLSVANDAPPPSWDWRTESVVFCADGRILPDPPSHHSYNSLDMR
jgi:predicted ATP-grasp superfamily ATP-dependent carboligase